MNNLDCDQIYVIKIDRDYGTPLPDEVVISSLEWLCKVKNIDLVLMSKTAWSLNIAPRLAFRTEAAYAHDCIDIKREGKEISCIRPVYGGNALAHISLTSDTPKVATVRAGSGQIPQKVSDTIVPIIEVEPEIDSKDLRVKINLIPLNRVKGMRLSAPSMEKIEVFRNILIKNSITTFIRFSKGQDVTAACGQLAIV